MKILRQGNPRVIRKEFLCVRCDCVFVAEPGEYGAVFHRNEKKFTAVCPCCGARTSTIVRFVPEREPDRKEPSI